VVIALRRAICLAISQSIIFARVCASLSLANCEATTIQALLRPAGHLIPGRGVSERGLEGRAAGVSASNRLEFSPALGDSK
jgi:hypothetical protein